MRTLTRNITNEVEQALGYSVVLNITTANRTREILLEVLHDGEIFAQGETYYMSETAARAAADDIIRNDMARRASAPQACPTCKGMGIVLAGKSKSFGHETGYICIAEHCVGGLLAAFEPAPAEVTWVSDSSSLIERLSRAVASQPASPEALEIEGWANGVGAEQLELAEVELDSFEAHVSDNLPAPAVEVPATLTIIEDRAPGGKRVIEVWLDQDGITPNLWRMVASAKILGTYGVIIKGTIAERKRLAMLQNQALNQYEELIINAGWRLAWIGEDGSVWHAPAAPVAEAPANADTCARCSSPIQWPGIHHRSGDQLCANCWNEDGRVCDCCDPPMSEIDRGYYNMREDNLAALRRAEAEHQEYLAEQDRHAGCRHDYGVCAVAERANADADAEEWYAANAPECIVCCASVAEWNRAGNTLCDTCSDMIPAHQIIPMFTQAWRKVADQLGANADHALIYDRTLDYMSGRITLESIQPAPAAEPNYACWQCSDTGQKIVNRVMIGSSTFVDQYGTCDHITAQRAAEDSLLLANDPSTIAACCNLVKPEPEYQCSECGKVLCVWHCSPYQGRDYCDTCRNRITPWRPVEGKPESTLDHARRILAQHNIEMHENDESGDFLIYGLTIKDIELIANAFEQSLTAAGLAGAAAGAELKADLMGCSDPVQLARFISEG